MIEFSLNLWLVLGMSMKIERSSLDQVKERFNKNKRKAEEKKDDNYDLQAQLKQAQQAEEERREQRKRRKKQHNEDEGRGGDGSGGADEDEMAKLMGFAGFGGAKKNNWNKHLVKRNKLKINYEHSILYCWAYWLFSHFEIWIPNFVELATDCAT